MALTEEEIEIERRRRVKAKDRNDRIGNFIGGFFSVIPALIFLFIFAVIIIAIIKWAFQIVFK